MSKTRISRIIAIGLAATLQAAVPTEWQVRIGPRATVYQAERYHGDALALRATLTSGGAPLAYQGSARLYAQTNGMDALWWDLADVTVSNNVLAATWLPEFDTGADVVDLFLGAPSNYQAHARIRLLPSPGPAPNALPLPAPVIDFATVEVRNLSALTNGWSFGGTPGDYAAVSNAAMSAAAQTNDFLRLTGGSMRGPILFPYFGDYGVGIWPAHPGALEFRSSYPDYSGMSATLDLLRIPTDGYGEIAFLSDIPVPPPVDFSTSNAALVATIEATAPAPGNYAAVSNRAMNADGNFLAVDGPFLWEAAKGITLRDGFLNFDNTDTGGGLLMMNYQSVIAEGSTAQWASIIDAADAHAEGLNATTGDLAAAADAATNYTDWAIQNMDPPIAEFSVYAEDVTNVADFVTSAAISTNNAAFVEAVRSTPLAGADPSDLAEIGEYGSYGTVGAAILALIAGLAALKRGKADKAELPYDIVAVTPSNGVVTVLPRTVATYTAGDSAAAFTVAVGVGTTGKARDCELVIDCTATGVVAPTVTWPATFHPRTDAATDFACETGKRNVYFISEYATGEFAVGGWQETAGGNA